MKFNIVKSDSHKKINGEWVHGQYIIVIDTIEAKNRREAFKIYTESISSKYHLNRRDLTAYRKNNQKRRRVEVVTVEPK